MAAAIRRRRRRPFSATVGLAVLALLLITAATAKDRDPRLYPPAPGSGVTVWLIDNGFHSDLVLPREAIADGRDIAGAAAREASDQPWIAVGWGDQDFYTRSGFTAARGLDGLRALILAGNPSVVRMEGLSAAPDRLFDPSAIRRIIVSRAGAAAMVARIDASLAADRGGAPIDTHFAGGPNVRFYRSVEHFNLLHMCNHWTAQLLNSAGLPVTPVIDTLPAGLKLDLKLRAGV